jgi:ABC-type Fe3+-citrate transport system substrate-binding protein
MIPIHGQPFLKKDPFSKAILNCNYEKLNSIKNMKELSNKYIEMEDRIDHIDKTLDDIKKLLQKITEKNN